jgi:hypothetical protein
MSAPLIPRGSQDGIRASSTPHPTSQHLRAIPPTTGWTFLTEPALTTWFDSAGAPVIGRLEAICDLSPEGRRLFATQLRVWSLLWWLGLVAAIPLVAVPLFLLAIEKGRPPAWYLAILPLLLSAAGCGLAILAEAHSNYLGWTKSRLLVGDRGWIYWTPRGATAFLWWQIPDDWRPERPRPSGWGGNWFPRWWVSLSDVYANGEVLLDYWHAELRKRQSLRESSTDTEADTGPLEMVLGPTSVARAQLERGYRFWRWLIRGYLLLVLLLLGGWLSAWLTLPGHLLLAAVLGAFGCSVVFDRFLAGYQDRLWLLETRYLLGDSGLAFWSAGQALVFRWADLGRCWTVTPHIPKEARQEAWFHVRLKLEAADGTTLLLSDLYENAAALEARILAELQRQASLGNLPTSSTSVTTRHQDMRTDAR